MESIRTSRTTPSAGAVTGWPTPAAPRLVREIDAFLDREPITHGYLIEGHGIYTWGDTMDDARRHLDAFEFLLNCELEMRKLGAHP